MTFEEILKQPLPSKMIDDELYVCEMPERDFNLGNKIGNCEISGWSKEGKHIPHFHIKSKNTNFNTAICLHVPMYFKHGKYKDELNSKQKKKLQACLKTKIMNGNTLWEDFVENWNASPEGSKNIVDINKMPNYTKMTESITER